MMSFSGNNAMDNDEMIWCKNEDIKNEYDVAAVVIRSRIQDFHQFIPCLSQQLVHLYHHYDGIREDINTEYECIMLEMNEYHDKLLRENEVCYEERHKIIEMEMECIYTNINSLECMLYTLDRLCEVCDDDIRLIANHGYYVSAISRMVVEWEICNMFNVSYFP